MANPTHFLRLALLLAFFQVAPSAWASNPQTIHEYVLGVSLQGMILNDGSVNIGLGDGTEPFVQAGFAGQPETHRGRIRSKSLGAFNALAFEGADNGHRGFSSRADDDGDGLIDEDPLDGTDNDEDGLIDEDFAAISDAMVAIRPGGPPGSLRAEYYHWAYTHLRSALFAQFDGSEGTPLVWQLTSQGGHWVETDIVARRHNIAGQSELVSTAAFVSQVTSDNDGPNHWLGFIVLDQATSSATAAIDRIRRVVVDGSTLSISLSGRRVPVVVCVGETWLQLNRLLVEATKVYEGVRDPVDKRQARWVVPALCLNCRLTDQPTFNLRPSRESGFLLQARLDNKMSGLIDPDAFQLEGQALGSPSQITWRAASGQSQTLEWTAMTIARLDRPREHFHDPYGRIPDLLEHDADGILEFRFSWPDIKSQPAANSLESSMNDLNEKELQGLFLDGRQLRTTLRQAHTNTPNPPEIHSDQVRGTMSEPDSELHRDATISSKTTMTEAQLAQALKSSNNHPLLAVDLLDNYPNPFSEVTLIRFTIPQTIGEAFTWEDEEEIPTGLDLRAAIPWTSGYPRVSVKIYSISGRELVTLLTDQAGSGQDVVQWDGTDAYGRPVASGTYFCKLQMDDWSVTRRVIFLR